MSRESFVFYVKWANAIKGCDAEVKAEVYDAIVEYVISGTVSGLKPLSQMAFNFIKPELDENISKYEAIRIARSNAGKLGGEKMVGNSNASKQSKTIKNNQKQSNEINEEQNQSKQTVYVNVYDNVNDNDNVIVDINLQEEEKIKKEEKEEKSFVAPIGATPSNIDERKRIFGKSLISYIDKYGNEMIRAFFDYWTEFNKSKTKMRFELQKTWETPKRLATWAGKDFNQPKQQIQSKGKIESNNDAIEQAINNL